MTQAYTAPGGEHASLKRTILRSFIGSIVLSALLGIWALLAGGASQLELKVLLSSLSVSAASLCAMGGAALLESRGERATSVPAIGFSCVGLALLLFAIWAEADQDDFLRLIVTTWILAVAASHLSLLRFARLAPRYRWLWPVTWILVAVLAAYGILLLWEEPNGEAFFRILGVLSILVAAVTLATPVLHRLGREDLTPASASPESVAMLCPSCGAKMARPLGDVECARCGARFRVALR